MVLELSSPVSLDVLECGFRVRDLIVVTEAGLVLAKLWVNSLEVGFATGHVSSVDTVPGPVTARLGEEVLLSIIQHEEDVTFTLAVSAFLSTEMWVLLWLPLAPASLLLVGEEVFLEAKVIVGTGDLGLP